MKIGIIGCGGVARNHIGSYIGTDWNGDRFQLRSEHPNNEVVAICDLREKAVEETFAHYSRQGYRISHRFFGEEAYKNLLDMALDGISICVPPIPDKVRIVSESLLAGKNILVEKPLSYDTESAKMILEAWDKHTVFGMCYNWRNTYIMRKLKELITELRYGSLHSISVFHAEPWNYHDPNSFYTKLGYLLEHNVHDINYLRYLNGEISSVEAVAYGSRLPTNPSSVTVQFEYQDGVSGTFHSMNGTRKSNISIQATFDKGLVYGLDSAINPDFEWSDGEYFRVFGPDGEIFAKPVYPIDDSDIQKGKISWERVGNQGVISGLSHQRIINNFLGAINNKEEVESDGQDGYRDIKVIYAIMKSIEEDKRILLRNLE